MSFVHLHVHSHFSLLNSTIQIDKYVEAIKKMGMETAALTDHGNLFGAVQFLETALSKPKPKDKYQFTIRPIFGAVINLATADGSDYHHLVLLAKTEQGYKNLRSLISDSCLARSAGAAPIVPMRSLESLAQDLIALSGCLGGEVPNALLRQNKQQAKEAATRLATLFGPDNFYLELQHNNLVEQALVNRELIELAKSTGIPLVATSNAHYLEPKDAAGYAVLVTIDLRRNLKPEQLRNMPDPGFHLATPQEMKAAFAHVPEAISNTVKIAESIDGITLKTNRNVHHFPIFETPPNTNTSDYLRTLAKEGLAKRLEKGGNPDVYNTRLESELDIIINLGFDAYYLIVWDFINWARNNGVPVGPGRGSGAGSLVAYALGITDIDPIKYDLLFERFLNPERVNPPDFDIDFCVEGRDRVIEYVREKYGADKVAQIITLGTIKAKLAIRDTARVLGIPLPVADHIAKLIPNAPDITLERAWAEEPRLPKIIGESSDNRLLWDISLQLEGLGRQPGKHAAGVVIADLPIDQYAPMYTNDDGSVVTQYSMKDLDAVGLIKFDFLGLMALTIIENTLKAVRKVNPDFDLETIPLDDKKTYELICDGMTGGIFQLETTGITGLNLRLKPDSVEDLTAAIALYRPGPLKSGMDTEFIAVKSGQKEASYTLEGLEPILKDTYGTILYQEQIMLIAQQLAGFSLGRADLLRRAMGKKDAKTLEEQRVPFMEGMKANGHDQKASHELFEKMAFFAEYGFNKSHSAAYAIIGYRMAYLKAHYPAEFLSAILTANSGNDNKIKRFIGEARRMNIQVFPPDVNLSSLKFTIQETKDGTRGVRFGLAGVKGIGDGAVESIVTARKDGPFKDITDFLARIDSRKINKRVVEALIRCGALDSFGHTRAAMDTHLDAMLAAANTLRADLGSGQMGLFDSEPTSFGPPHVPEWPMSELLEHELAVTGYYISGHPMDGYHCQFGEGKVMEIGALTHSKNGDQITIAGIVTDADVRTTKRNTGQFAFLNIEDATGMVRCFVHPSVIDQWLAIGRLKTPILVRGQVEIENEGDEPRILVESLNRLDSVLPSLCKALHLNVDLDTFKLEQTDEVVKILAASPGHSNVLFKMHKPGVGVMTVQPRLEKHCVKIDDQMLARLRQVLGDGNVEVR